MTQPDTPTFGIGMLCYKRYDKFRTSLKSYQKAGLFDLADETLIAFNGLDQEGRELAAAFDLPFVGSEANTGILGGFKLLADSMKADIVLLLENDVPLIVDRDELTRQISLARKALTENQVEVFRMRHRVQPGAKFQSATKFLRYYEPSIIAQLRRLVRPGKAKRLIGNALYVYTHPDRIFPEIELMSEGWLRVPAKHITWTNQSVMLRRSFFLENILGYAEAHPSNRTVNGFPDIEKELNSAYWRQSGWRIGADLGLFTHLEG